MFRVTKLIPTLMLLASGATAFGAESHGLSAAAEPLFHVGPLPITNSMVTSWVVAIVLIVMVRLAIGRPKLIPGRGQAVVENLVTGLIDLTTPIVGTRAAKASFPLLAALFTYILIQNWSGLVPGVGTIFYHGHEFVRPGNADLNSTFALAIVSTVCWLYLVMRYAGPSAFFKDLFGNKADKKEVPAAIYYPLFFVFFGVGLIEIISIAFRPISLSFRLFGNVFGGENLLHSMSAITPWVLPVPFYFLELLIGFVQALVFTLLVSVYIGLICNHGDGHEGEEHDHH